MHLVDTNNSLPPPPAPFEPGSNLARQWDEMRRMFETIDRSFAIARPKPRLKVINGGRED